MRAWGFDSPKMSNDACTKEPCLSLSDTEELILGFLVIIQFNLDIRRSLCIQLQLEGQTLTLVTARSILER